MLSDMMGAISGARIMAPITTGAESANSPSVASTVESTISTRYETFSRALSRRIWNRSLNSSVDARRSRGSWFFFQNDRTR